MDVGLIAVAVVAFSLGLGVGYYVWGMRSAEGSVGDPSPVVVAPAAKVTLTVDPVRDRLHVSDPARKTEPWRVAFYSGSGRRLLGRETRRDRRMPTLKYRGMDGLLGVYAVTGQEASGEWVYRRVGVERE